MSGGSSTQLANGSHIIVGGLILQLVSLAIFILIALLFDRKIRRLPTPQSVAAHIPWYKHHTMLYFASALIVVRNIIRVLEYAQGDGHAGFVLSHEAFLYCFDALLMFTLMGAFNVVYPGEIKVLIQDMQLVGKLWTLKRVARRSDAAVMTDGAKV